MQNTQNTNAQTDRVRFFCEAIAKVREQLARDFVGQQEAVENVLIAMIAGGNVLLEGVPGVGKTRLVRSLGRVFAQATAKAQKHLPDTATSTTT